MSHFQTYAGKPNPRPDQVKVFNVSLHRSGTQSFQRLCQSLGLRTQHWPGQAFDESCEGALAGLDRKAVWDLYRPLVEGGDAFADLPAPLIFAEAARDYPTARFLLIRRSKWTWVSSVRRHTSGRQLDVMEKFQYWSICSQRRDHVSEYSDGELAEGYDRHEQTVTEVMANLHTTFRVFDLETANLGPSIAAFCGCPGSDVPFEEIDINRRFYQTSLPQESTGMKVVSRSEDAAGALASAQLPAVIARQLSEFLKGANPNKREFFEKFSITAEDILRLVNESIRRLESDATDRATWDCGPPKLIHRLWLTSEAEGHMPPAEYLTQIARQAKKISSDYQYNFWCNSRKIAAEVAEVFSGSDAKIVIRNLEAEFQADPLIAVVKHFIGHRKYVMASDIAKFMILQRFGGVYADLGVQFDNSLLSLVQRSDAGLFLDQGMFFQPAFMAFRLQSPVVRLWCEILLRPEALSAIAFPDATQFNAGQEVWLHGGVGFTAVFLLFHQSNVSTLVLPPQGAALQTTSQGSWYTDGNKFGNVILRDATSTHLDIEEHRQQVRKLCSVEPTTSVTARPSVIRHKILSGLPRYFWLTDAS